MQYEQIKSDRRLVEYCKRIADAPYIAFDTEFVSEDSYRPELCLVQVATPDELAIIDPLALNDMTPFWNAITDGEHETIVHAGREELRFCLHAVDRRPRGLFDIQLAAGMIGHEYPASYGNLISRVLDTTLPKGETRTDWRRRPLSQRQLDYALQDVTHLKSLRDHFAEKLNRLGRTEWYAEEIRLWQDQIEEFERTEQWWRVSGMSGLGRRGLAVVRELWRWREDEARRRNRPVRRVLRDDLIIELARRQIADPRRIGAVRGLEYRGIKEHLPSIAAAVQRGLDLPDDALPRLSGRRQIPQFNVLAQFLAAALANLCRSAEIAPTIVGTADDVRELIVWELSDSTGRESPPSLMMGWRKTLAGEPLVDLLRGRCSLRVANPSIDNPLRFEPSPPPGSDDSA